MFEQLTRRDPTPAAPRAEPKPNPEPKRWSRRDHWMETPWKLTGGQIRTLEALLEYGGAKHAAPILGQSERTLETHCLRARKAMNVKTTLQAAVLFDRFLRSQTHGSP